MNNTTKKLVLYLFVIILSISFVMTFGCSIQSLIDLANTNIKDMNPKWDIEISLPLLDNTISLEDNMETITIGPYDETIDSIPQWPAPILGFDLSYDLSGSLVGENLTIDFDDDGSDDFVMEAFRSTDASLVLKIWLTNNADVTLDVSPDDFSIGTFKIEGVEYFLGTPIIEDKVLVYTAANFLDPTEDYYFDLAGDAAHDPAAIDVESFKIALIPDNTPDYTGANPYALIFQLIFTIGQYEAVGTIINDVNLYEKEEIPIPLNETFERIENFKFDFEFETKLPLAIGMNMTFNGDTTPDPCNYDVTIDAATCSQGIHNDWYSTGVKLSESSLGFKENIIDYGDMNMDFRIKLQKSSRKIRLSTSDYLSIKINAKGEATISSEF
ncbi:MAG: hypothetical protein KAT05_01005 [Spirochaetes bacterium]|nr:hypothetical protein [Spirochaetota bacterium]